MNTINSTAQNTLNPVFAYRHAISVRPTRLSGAPLALFVCLALLVSSISHAAPTAYESFNYAAGNLNNGAAAAGDGFSGSWTCGVSGWILSGLTYAGLPVANNAVRSGAARQFVYLATPLSSGTKWISFLYKTSAGNPGGNINGVYFPNGNSSCLWFGFGLAPYSGTQGQLGLGSMTTAGTSATGATSLMQLGLGTYGSTYLVVLKIDFNTAGNNDTVTVYLNPVANVATPGVTAAGTHNAYDVGTISGVGLNVTGAGEIIVDEIRVGNSYGDVVGYISISPNTPTGLNANPGTNLVSLSWTASSNNPIGYNVKRSADSVGPYTTVNFVTAPKEDYDDAILGGTTYYYVVSAVNSAGESSNSAFVAATPILAAPEAPGGLSATAGDAQVSLSWTASEFATSYEVKRAADLAGPYTYLDTTASLTYDDSGLNNAVTCYYVVAAIGAGGASADTSPVSATPFGPLPLVLTIRQGVGITWFASNSVMYQVQWANEDLGTNTVWNTMGETISGDGTTNTVFDPAGPPHNRYQVISIQ